MRKRCVNASTGETLRSHGIVFFMPKLSEVLKERGYIHQFSSKKLEEITDGPRRSVYLGIDPSADSLQVGQLQAFLILRRFLEDGHKVILVIGGGTGMIGDPGGRSTERNLLDADTVAKNGEAISAQVKKLFGGEDFTLVNNAQWLEKLTMLEFLRDVGKHFPVNTMLQRDFVKERIDTIEQGISYTEFSYALLQAYDFLHLHTKYACDVQVGGSDQWGNIVSGVDFIRRKTGDTVYAFTWPLLINKATGKKFGKSEEGTVWLDAAKTSPFQFYQFWLNTEDEFTEEYLLKMTMLSRAEIAAVLELHKRKPKERQAQVLLARTVTELVHGEESAQTFDEVSSFLFYGAHFTSLSEEARKSLLVNAPTHEVEPEKPVIDVLIRSGLASSKREVRAFLKEKAISLNGSIVKDEKRKLATKDFSNGIALLKRGKRNVCVLVLSETKK